MTTKDIIALRLTQQQLLTTKFKTAGDIVSYFGAVQAQDYPGAKWALGLRLPGTTDQIIEKTIADGQIVRTWPMRGTLHFVAPQDIRWMIELLAPRVIRGAASRYRELGLTDHDFGQSKELFIKALEGGKQLSRPAMYQVLENGGVSPAEQRGIHILGRLAMEGLLCFGTREGKQFTFRLLDEWVPKSKRLDKDEAIAELTKRYFISHGPATIQDFAWWSGLTQAEIKVGLEIVKDELDQMSVDSSTYWFQPKIKPLADTTTSLFLLPAYDEYMVAYKDRSLLLEEDHIYRAKDAFSLLSPTIIIDGKIIGNWTRTTKKDTVVINLNLFRKLTASEHVALEVTAQKFGDFHGLSAKLSF